MKVIQLILKSISLFITRHINKESNILDSDVMHIVEYNAYTVLPLII
ncbi:hypothetical protein BBC0122_020490 [Bartonella choladocola]|uniref:Uncharacterized protein n=1 Tax=Bartonella choladocola TaxID=2750995 RepID=A0A1U9MKA9_9HYPH|nr:hypothetical protein BBC0122_020490 [Bartonella choladocola]